MYYYIKDNSTNHLVSYSMTKNKAKFVAHWWANLSDINPFWGEVFTEHYGPDGRSRIVVATIKDGQVLAHDGTDWLANYDHA